MKVVAQSCPTPGDRMDCSPPGSSVHGVFQARVLEWVVIAFSDGLLRCLFIEENSLSGSRLRKSGRAGFSP